MSEARRHDIDWLRVVAVLLLIPFHSAVIFNRYAEWYVTNEAPSLALEAFAYFLSQWRMPLLFFVSGVGTVFALGFRTPRKYIRERAGRLLIPLAFGVLVIVPPQVYLWRRSDPGYELSYWEFYPTFFNGVRPEGNFEWAHLWFLAYLFVFSLLALPMFLHLRSEAGKGLLACVSTIFETPWGIFAPALPLVLVQAVLRARWPGFPPNLYDDWANFAFYLILFVYGYALFLVPGFDRALRRRWKASLLLGVGTMSVIFLVLGTGNAPEIGYTPAFVAFAALHGLNTWLWLVVVVGAARTYLGFENRVLRYLRDAVYPTYILHQTVVVVVGFLVMRWELGVAGKFAIIVLASLAVTLTLYELVRRAGVLRPLFGLKPKGRRKVATVAGDGPNRG